MAVLWFGTKAASKTIEVTPLPSPSPTPVVYKDDIERYAKEYGINEYQYRMTLKCESGYSHEEVYGDGGRAYGISQFHKPTFDGFVKTAISQGYAFEGYDYYDRENQLEVMAWAFKNQLQTHWTCWTKQFSRR